jgi:hypothetical protein
MSTQATIAALLLAWMLVLATRRRRTYHHVEQYMHDARLARRLGRLAGRADYAEHRQCPPPVDTIPQFDPTLPRLRRDQNASYCLDVVFDAARHDGWVECAHEEIDSLVQPGRQVA